VRLALTSLDRLVELVEESGGLVSAARAAEHLLAVATPPEEVALSLLRPLVEDDARLAWRGGSIALAGRRPTALVDAGFVVFDLETTGLAVADARICEIGAVRIQRLERAATFETLVDPGTPALRHVGCLAGVSSEALRLAPRAEMALRRFSAFAGDAVLVAHNARFDVGFVNHELARLAGSRLSTTVIDTLPLARNLLRGRVEKANLASLSFFFGVSAEPCHRALPDALATAEVFLRLVELAQERGASTVGELEELATPRSRQGGPARADRCSASM
jgi:DNA polymerase III epsilon subunit family exonuclease